MNYKQIEAGVMDSESKIVVGVIFEIDEGLFVRILTETPRPAYAWSPSIYSKWDPYRVECPSDQVPEGVKAASISVLSDITKPDARDIMGGRATYQRIVELFGDIQ